MALAFHLNDESFGLWILIDGFVDMESWVLWSSLRGCARISEFILFSANNVNMISRYRMNLCIGMDSMNGVIRGVRTASAFQPRFSSSWFSKRSENAKSWVDAHCRFWAAPGGRSGGGGAWLAYWRLCYLHGALAATFRARATRAAFEGFVAVAIAIFGAMRFGMRVRYCNGIEGW